MEEESFEESPVTSPSTFEGEKKRSSETTFLAILVALMIFGAVLIGSGYVLYRLGYLDTGPDLSMIEWCHEQTQVDILHDAGLDGEGVVVGLVDTGMDTSHPSLDHVDILHWEDLINGKSKPYDDGHHGTQMGGIIFSKGELTGVAPRASCILVKAVKSDGTSDDETIAHAIRICMNPDEDISTDDGADVISLSLGSEARRRSSGSLTESAVRDALQAGIVVVSAAGNDGEADDGQVDSPSTVEFCISVGAVDSEGDVAYFSSIGNNGETTHNPIDDRLDPNKKPECVAPGVEVVTTDMDDEYVLSSGTSAATAYTAGIIALILMGWTVNSSADIYALKNALMDSSLKVEGQELPHDPWAGYGIIQGESLRVALG